MQKDLVVLVNKRLGVSKKSDFLHGHNDRTKGNGFKLKEGRFRSEVRNKFFTQTVVGHYNWLPRKAVGVPSLILDVFKARLDEALGNLIWWVAP